MDSLLLDILNITINAVMLLVFLRFIFQLAGVDRFNPVVISTVRVTKLVDIFGRILPTVGDGRLNLAALIIIVLLKFIDLTFTNLFATGNGLEPADLILSTLFELLFSFLKFCKYMIFGSIIVSWIMVLSPSRSPVIGLVMQMAEPLLAPIRRILPDTGPLDLSPIVALLLLMICQKLLMHAAFSLDVLTASML